jgi:hypothetical protein
MQRSSTPVDQYLASLPDDRGNDMVELDARIAPVFAGQERVVWEGIFWGGSEQQIIGYGSYHYVGRSGAEGDWFIVGLAMQKNYLSLYVNASVDGDYLIKRYAGRLGKVKGGSANVTFKRAADLEMDAVVEMVTRARDAMSGSAA